MIFPRCSLLLMLFFAPLFSARAQDWTEARELGLFTAAGSRGDVAATNDRVELHFDLAPGSSVGAWFKDFASAPGAQDAVTARLNLDLPERIGYVPASLELKGSAGYQSQNFRLRPGSNKIRVLIDPSIVGQLQETVLLLHHPGGDETWSGTLDVRGRFGHVPDWQLWVMDPWNALLMLLVLALALRFLLPGLELIPRTPWNIDIARGLAALMVMFSMFILHAPAMNGAAGLGHWRLLAALVGGIAGGLITWSASTRRPSGRELFRNTFLPGLLLLAATDIPVWAVPACWEDVLKMNATGASIFFGLYHLIHAYQAGTHRAGISAAAAWTLTLAPFATGILLALPNREIMYVLGAGGPVWIGRALTLLLLNLLATIGFSGLAGKPGFGGWEGFKILALTALATAIAPRVADAGSGSWDVASPLIPLAAILGTALSQGALWAQVYLITGLLLDAIAGKAATADALRRHAFAGFQRAVIFGAVLMGLVQLVAHLPALAPVSPWLLILAGGSLAMPLIKAIVESFDGSAPFARRVAQHYRDPVLLLRGFVAAGFLMAAGSTAFPALSTYVRAGWSFLAGAMVYAGVSLLRDVGLLGSGRGRIKGIRLYGCEVLLGGLAGAALGFYFDASQVQQVVAKFGDYAAYGQVPRSTEIYPLFSKWGFLRLGEYAGGARLLFNEALHGVIAWGLAAWLFALNRSFLQAALDRDASPIRRVFSQEGLKELGAGTLYVLRWGLWMAPIIFTFIRRMGEPTWYNQDGGVRTLLAIAQDLRLDSAGFESWSRNVFLGVLAHDAFRLLIWLDHMGLRVATLVNLSFIGMDRLDERLARFVGARDATARMIPEAVKRMATWLPLLIPFYLPVGAAWDDVWSRSEAIQRTARGLTDFCWELSIPQRNLAAAALLLSSIGIARIMRVVRARHRAANPLSKRLTNRVYDLRLLPSGELRGLYVPKGYDLTRRSYEGRDPAGRILFVTDENGQRWPVIGNFADARSAVTTSSDRDAIWIERVVGDLLIRVRITLPIPGEAVEQWTVTLENRGVRARAFTVVPYLEWNLNTAEADRNHTQYNRLFHEVSCEPSSNALFAFHRYTKWVGFLASDVPPSGQLKQRVDFIGRGGTVWDPAALAGGRFNFPIESKQHPVFDAIASLSVPLVVAADSTQTVRFLVGGAANRNQARVWIHRQFPGLSGVPESEPAPVNLRHGVLPLTAELPYYEFRDAGQTLHVRTPFTPRPWDHTLANALGHVVSVTNRGLNTTSSVNSQQNRLTPDWPDTTARELPAEAIYLFDEEAREWLAPTFEPVRDAAAQYTVDYSVHGHATFHMQKGRLSTELSVFVPPGEPAGVYRLIVRNHGSTPRRLRCAPYFQLALADRPEHAGGLTVDATSTDGTIWFTNTRNSFRKGYGFLAVSVPFAAQVTDREVFFGADRRCDQPRWVEQGETAAPARPGAKAAAFLVNLVVPPGGERTLVIVLGQADTREAAAAARDRLCSEAGAARALDVTQAWWRRYLSTVRIEASEPAFGGMLDWLKYQAIAERIWARRGFYQASGAYGYRDQLQDAVNMIWVDPKLARKQILLHAAQQFEEGDAVHWFFLLADGRTGFSSRSHAYDNLLWLGWAAVEYLRMTGDGSLLDEPVAYLRADQPFIPLPAGKHGMGFFPHRSPVVENVFDHVMRAIDLVLERRMGRNGLPLIGAGDWNDGLDEIGSEGKGESVWLGFFLHYILERLLPQLQQRRGDSVAGRYRARLSALREALEATWRGDRYLRAFHDDGSEIGVKGSGIWEIDALTAAWAVFSGINPARARRVFDTALRVLERGPVIHLGWPALREDSTPYLGRSSRYPEGVRENGMYCHGVQWLVGAARQLAEQCQQAGDAASAAAYRATAWRLWRKISPLDHVTPEQIEIFGGQPNKQPADYLTAVAPGRMIWNGYTGAAGWMLRQALEGVAGARLVDGHVEMPADLEAPRGNLTVSAVHRDVSGSPL